MADWSNQIAEYQRAWVAQQQKLLTEWMESLKGAGGDATAGNLRQAANIMEKQVDSALDMQKRSLLSFMENVDGVEGAPEAFKQSVKQLEQGIEQWAEVQHKIWHVWFDALRAVSPEPPNPTETMMKNWEEMVKQTMSIQEQWLSSWTEGADKDKDGT